MKIAVCLKQVPARDAPLRIDPARAWVSDQDTGFEINEADAHALEEALLIKDRDGAEVVLISVGPERVTQVLREGLAKGADRAIHVLDPSAQERDPTELASLLASVAVSEEFGLILTGQQSDDAGFGQTGVALAELLDIPHASIVTRVKFDSDALNVTREVGGGWFQELALSAPAVLTLQAGINKPRYAGMKGIMAAKRKEIRTLAVTDLEGQPRPKSQRIEALFFPQQEKTTEFLEGAPAEVAAQLLDRLSPLISRS